MKFTPKSTEQIAQEEKERAERFLWPVGDYSFEILEAEEAVDGQGRDMLKLKVKVFKDNGASQNIFDYVSGAWMEFKLRHLAEVCGQLSAYESGELDAYNFVGKTGTCKVGISKDKNGQYPDRNDIKDYIVKGTVTSKPTVDDSDEIPF